MDIHREILDVAEHLIQFRTTAQHLDELQVCTEYIASYFDGTGLTVNRFEHGGKPSLVVSFTDTKTPSVMFNGHIDVVPGPEKLFKPVTRDGKLYGRGAADMKTAVATFMVLFRQLAAEERRPDAAVMIVPDEEVGSVHGTDYLINEEEYRPSFMLAGEPNHADPGHIHITTRQKGILRLRLHGDGESAHSSRPWNGENAIIHVMDAYRTIAGILEEEAVDEDWHATAEPVQVRGGDATNVLPSGAELLVDVRYTADTPIDRVLETVRDMETVAVGEITRSPIVDSDHEDEYLQALQKAAAAEYESAAFGRTHGSSDLHYATAYGIPAVEYGVTGGNIHAENEYAYLESIPRYYNSLKRFLNHAA